MTVGTELPFDRLVAAIDGLCASGELGDVYMQIGARGSAPRRARYARLIPYDAMEAAVREADLVIAHAGPGSISLARNLGRKPLIMPRRPDLGEVVDEHQLLLAARLAGLGLANVVYEADQILSAIGEVVSRGDTTVPSSGGEELAAAVNAFESLVAGAAAPVPLRRKLWDWRRNGRRR